MKKPLYLSGFLFLFLGCFSAQVTDINGKTYKTVVIGSQTWMAENLNVNRFRNGDLILEAKTSEEWNLACENQQPAWCYYNFDAKYNDRYGILYNWSAINDSRGLAPKGFHVPSVEDWSAVSKFLGDDWTVADKLKSSEIIETKISYEEVGGYYTEEWVACTNCKNWNSEYRNKVACHVCKDERGKYVKGKYIPKTKKKIEEKINIGWNGNNSSGFSALPGGFLWRGSSFDKINESCEWWSSTVNENGKPLFYSLQSLKSNFYSTPDNFSRGCYVRCISSNISVQEQLIKVKLNEGNKKEDELLMPQDNEKKKLENIYNSLSNDPKFLQRIYCSFGETDSIIFFDMFELGEMNWVEAYNFCSKIGNEFRLPTTGEMKIINQTTAGRIFFNHRIFWTSKNELACVHEKYKNNGKWDETMRETDYYKGRKAIAIAIRTEPLKRFTVYETNKTFEVLNQDIVMPCWDQENEERSYKIEYEKEIENFSVDGWRIPHVDELKVLIENNVVLNNNYWYAYSNYIKGNPDSYVNVKSLKNRTNFNKNFLVGVRLVREVE